MHSLADDFAAGRLEGCAPPCLSLYLPTHRRHPENRQDPVRFRQLVKTLEESLARRAPQPSAAALLEKFHELEQNGEFWRHAQDGLAVLAAEGLFRVYRVQRPVPELAIAADSFHLKPLLRILQSADRFQILGLDRRAIRLFEGNRDALDEIAPAPGVPRTIEDALGDELTEPHLTVASYGGAGKGEPGMHHGHGGRADEVDKDDERFFRAVSQAVLEHHSRPSRLPLILATLPEHRHRFHEVSHNPFLLESGIDAQPDTLTPDELRKRAWAVMEPHFLQRLAALVDDFHVARARGSAFSDAQDVARAAVGGRVATLLVEADRVLPGRIDAATGAVRFDDIADPQVDDVLDDLAALVLRQGGDVVIVPAARMPAPTGLAAICRY